MRHSSGRTQNERDDKGGYLQRHLHLIHVRPAEKTDDHFPRYIKEDSVHTLSPVSQSLDKVLDFTHEQSRGEALCPLREVQLGQVLNQN